MTRKQAITKAISALQQEGGNEEAIQVLKALSAELPIIHWSDATLRDTVDQFIADTGRMPAATDFKNPGMPPYRVFMCNYGLTPTEWLQTNYPEHYPTQADLKDLYTKAFIEDYMRLKPTSADDFNERRSDKTFSMKEGTLYPVLHGLERRGAVEVYQQAAPTGRIRKYYHLTSKGRLLLEEEKQEWNTYTRAVSAVLESCAEPGLA